MGELAFKSFLSNQEIENFKTRKVIYKKPKAKIATVSGTTREHPRSYAIEISFLKEKIYILLIDMKSKTRAFQLDNSRSRERLDHSNGNTILMLQLWKKQIEHIFMNEMAQTKETDQLWLLEYKDYKDSFGKAMKDMLKGLRVVNGKVTFEYEDIKSWGKRFLL